MSAIGRTALNIVHTVFLVVVFAPILLFCTVSMCIGYDGFCGVREWISLWLDAVREVWMKT